MCYHKNVDIWNGLMRNKRQWDKHLEERARLQTERRELVLAALEEGAPPRMIATILGVTPEAIYQIKRGDAEDATRSNIAAGG